MLTNWSGTLNPLLANLLTQGQLLQSVPLVSGSNPVNHKLQRKLIGWYVTRRRQFKVTGTPTAYDIYDTQDSNQTPELTLTLTSSQGTSTNPVLVDLWVF